MERKICCKIDLIFEDFKDLTLSESNEKFSVDIKEKEVIICAKDYSSLRAGINAVIKELIIIEKMRKEVGEKL